MTSRGSASERISPTALAFTSAPVPLRIDSCGPQIWRLRFGSPDDDASYLAPIEWPQASLSAAPGNPSTIEAGAIRATMSEGGELVIGEPARGCGVSIDLSAMRLQPSLSIKLTTQTEQHFYGLGAGGQPFDRLGTTRRLWTGHVNHGSGVDMPVPLLLSSKGYGLFFDDSSAGLIDVRASSVLTSIEHASEAQALDIYYIDGGDLRATLCAAARLLGLPPMPPRWALGYLQSTRHFENTDELRDLPRRFRDKNIPCDALILLSTYSDFRGWNRGVGHLECEPDIIPDPAALFAALRGEHVHLVTHEYPVLHDDSPLHAEATAKGYLLEVGYPKLEPTSRPSSNYREGQRFIDFSNSEASAWWWGEHRRLVEFGVEGWWLDGGEGPPADARLHRGSGAQLHNRYDLFRQQAFFEGEGRDHPDRRAFLLCRSGGAGMQRFGAACWSGDINNTFATFEHQPGLGLNVGLSVIPYWNSDIGGFYSVAPDSAELFLRWFQFGAFCPIFRSHGHSWRLHLPWSYGDAAEAICREYIAWRYRLMPYTYTLAWQAHRQGLPLMRPLILNYPDDPRAYEIAEAYLWGDDLLVAPVTRDGARHWPVYLPKGRWYDFWTHEAHEGPVSISVDAPLERLPLFVRQGALLPLGPVLQYEGERKLNDIEILVYPAERSSFTLYEDDGVTRGYERGNFALTEMACVREGDAVVCTLREAKGKAGLLPADRRYTLKVHSTKRPRFIEVDGKRLAGRKVEGKNGWRYERPFAIVDDLKQPAAVKLVYS